MFKDNFISKINAYDTIIIHRHTKPDMDAIGSQVGLSEIIKANFPTKKVYMVGEQNKFDKENLMDQIEDNLFIGALTIIVDVAVTHMVSDTRYLLSKETIVIDHHKNDCDIENVSLFISDSSYSSCAELITDMALFLNLIITQKSAQYLFSGMVTDTGRFQWMTNPSRVFKLASKLTELGAKPTELYDFLYVETLESKKMKTYFQSKFTYEDGVAYLKNDASVFELFNVDVFTVSRGMVNLASGIEEIPIWLNFTYDLSKDVILGEFRSRGIVIVDIAKKYGGGGHDQACGATLKSWQEVDEVIADYKKLLKESKK